MFSGAATTAMEQDSSNQQLVVEANAMNNGRDVIGQEQSNGDVVNTSEKENKKTEVPITYEDLKPHFGRKLHDAAKSLGVGRSKLKRICRKLGIKKWPAPKRKKRKASLPELKLLNEPVQSAKEVDRLTVAFPVPGALASAQTQEPVGEKILIDSKRTSHDLTNPCPTAGDADCHRGLEFGLHAARTPMALALVPNTEDSTRSPKASTEALQFSESSATIGFRNPWPSAVTSSQQDSEQELQLAIGSQPANSLSDHLTSQPETPLAGMPMQNGISSEPIDKCCILATTEQDTCPKEEIAREEAYTKPRDTAMQDASTLTVRAKYGDITIKFRLSVSSGLVELQEQVAKRLNLVAETYRIEYKDEEADDELILIACNEDLKDYIDTSRSLGKTSIVLWLKPKQPV